MAEGLSPLDLSCFREHYVRIGRLMTHKMMEP